ncbi:TatD family deoxyribonuclease [Micromonospora zingiberis]|uniref:TatD family deoxyribonuclease n=1 Tax=Micromonospora zingiberis TaxID=2053011 RepID=A0A4R0FWH0_9ACTN|nr:TatD family hydrolase [Micromonospora zingiberis]TCB87732.1 TatD family deoxyribonuclease [Micromonospora zingiberis]
MTTLPALDLHAHVDTAVSPRDLLNLRAVVFAASRSLAESHMALRRQPGDLLTVWGVGVHPGMKESLENYDPEGFGGLIERTAYVGEIGLDAKIASRLRKQHEVLESVLTQLQGSPRLTSIHSYGATTEIVDHLERNPITGAILHWWLGGRAATSRAIDLGAYFSINAATIRRSEALDLVPIDRILPETDHPDGNRGGARPHQPGNVTDVETALATMHGLDVVDFRLQTWRNLASLVAVTETRRLLPPRVAAIIEAVN